MRVGAYRPHAGYYRFEGGTADRGTAGGVAQLELDEGAKRVVRELQARDSEVRAHEMAHLSAAGGIATGGANYTYQRGPDGRMYAVGGEVPISVKEGNTPQETAARMRQVAAAALAPADPSPQDYAVAAAARSKELAALQKLRKAQQEQLQNRGLQTYRDLSSTFQTS